jgi:hypothetical protein
LAALIKWWAIPHWQADYDYVQTECTIVDKRLDQRYKPAGYRAQFLIRYEAADQTHEEWTYDATQNFSSDDARQQAILDEFAVGSVYPCWHAVDDPTRVVLVRRNSWWVWLMTLVPLPLIAIGGGGLAYSLVYWRTSAERRAALALRASELAPLRETGKKEEAFPTTPAAANWTNSPGTQLAYRLPLEATGNWRLAGMVAFCIAWNGIVALFFVLAVGRHIGGSPDWMLDLFVAAFAAVGGWAAYRLWKQALAAGGIGPTWVEASDQPFRPGKNYDVLVYQAGRLDVRRITVELTCVETASYRQGTDVRTEWRVVSRKQLLEQTKVEIRSSQPLSQRARVEISPGAMHSFQAPSNEIRWSIDVTIDAEGWPVCVRSFPVVLFPSPLPEGSP